MGTRGWIGITPILSLCGNLYRIQDARYVCQEFLIGEAHNTVASSREQRFPFSVTITLRLMYVEV